MSSSSTTCRVTKAPEPGRDPPRKGCLVPLPSALLAPTSSRSRWPSQTQGPPQPHRRQHHRRPLARHQRDLRPLRSRRVLEPLQGSPVCVRLNARCFNATRRLDADGEGGVDRPAPGRRPWPGPPCPLRTLGQRPPRYRASPLQPIDRRSGAREHRSLGGARGRRRAAWRKAATRSRVARPELLDREVAAEEAAVGAEERRRSRRRCRRRAPGRCGG